MIQWSQPEPYLHGGRIGTLAEHLGRGAGDKLLIVNADDYGLTEGANRTALELADAGLVSSTTIMMTGSACKAGISLLQGSHLDCGVHITLTSSLASQPAEPVSDATLVASLLNQNGAFHYDREEFFEHATAAEASLEAAAQLEAAEQGGVDVTHIDSHEGTLQLRPQFAEVYVELAIKHALPIRMGSRALLHQLGLPANWIERLHEAGLHFPDNLVYLPIDSFSSLDEKIAFVVGLLSGLPAGVTEIFFHPLNPDYAAAASVGNDEIAQFRVWDYQVLAGNAYQTALTESGAELISFAPLRELCRKSVSP